jgi:hypothetical protein
MTTKSEEDQEWQELCALIGREKDPQRLSQLVDELIKVMDQRKQGLGVEAKKNSASKPSRG